MSNINRVDQFLENYDFSPNSIDFRIVSSKALEKFKNVQSFQLNEIRNGRYKFGSSRRELLLLKFDLLTRVLAETEKVCIQNYHNNEGTTELIVSYTLEMLRKSRKLYNEIITSHPELFDPVFAGIWTSMLDKKENLLIGGLTSLISKPLEIFFSSLVDIISSFIQNGTFELYELDVKLAKYGHTDKDYKEKIITLQGIETTDFNIYEPKDMMLVISNLTNTTNTHILSYVKDKLDIYINKFGISHVYFKNLSDHEISPNVIELVESLGLVIDYKKSI